MGNDWNPDAPDVNKEFSRAERAEQKPLTRKRTPVSKLELDKLREERGKPTLKPTLTIGGKRETSVHKQVEIEKEKERGNRKQYIKERLGSMRGQAKNDFDRSRDDDDMSW
jgi:hypothetical protein